MTTDHLKLKNQLETILTLIYAQLVFPRYLYLSSFSLCRTNARGQSKATLEARLPRAYRWQRHLVGKHHKRWAIDPSIFTEIFRKRPIWKTHLPFRRVLKINLSFQSELLWQCWLALGNKCHRTVHVTSLLHFTLSIVWSHQADDSLTT